MCTGTDQDGIGEKIRIHLLTNETTTGLLKTWTGASSCSNLEQVERLRKVCILPADIENLDETGRSQTSALAWASISLIHCWTWSNDSRSMML
jgi:hypothetical protein